MIEAFEIGVSLALRDGVSDSIAQAQRNVEALQKAVDANGLSVRALRDAGARAVSLVRVQPEPEKRQRKGQPRATRSETAEAAPAPDGISRHAQADRAEAPVPRAPERNGGERVIERDPIETPWEKIARAPEIAATTPRDELDSDEGGNFPSMLSTESPEPPKIDFVAPTDGRRGVEPQPQTGAPTARAVEQDLPMTGLLEQPVAAFGALQLMGVQEMPAPAALPQAPTAPGDDFQRRSPAPSRFATAKLGSAEQTGLGDWAPVTSERADRLQTGSTTEAEATQPRAGGGTDDPGARAGWFNPSPGLPIVPAVALPQEGSVPQSMAPQARGDSQGQPGGDVYLDGLLVGRWMSRFLKREAERAEAGPTGFDAKRGRLLPGVTVGG